MLSGRKQTFSFPWISVIGIARVDPSDEIRERPCYTPRGEPESIQLRSPQQRIRPTKQAANQADLAPVALL